MNESRRQRLFVLAALFATFLAYSLWYAPLPGINEPHYLSKAKFFWNSAWCDGDLFLESSNPHYVFYATFGLLTQFLSLEQTAWVGRIVSLLLVAVGWRKLIRCFIDDEVAALFTAWLFLGIWSIINFSGEWLIGGVESKVMSYGFVFLSIAWALESRFIIAAASLGAGISYHPVVGGWSLVAAVLGLGLWWIRSATNRGQLRSTLSQASTTKLMTPVVWLIIFSLPGLIPALALFGNAEPKVSWAANYIQVYYRLAHHLDPKQFSWTVFAAYGTMLGGWTIVSRRMSSNEAYKYWRYFVWGSFIVALAGLAIGMVPKPTESLQYGWAMTALKFYPFRLFDLVVPLSVAIALIQWAIRSSVLDGKYSRHGIGVVCAAVLITGSFNLGAWAQHPSKMSASRRAHWIDVCEWISENTPEDAVFLTPPKESWAFKWFSNRAEYVSRKDCPQDAEGIVEWNRRLQYLGKWASKHYGDERFTLDEIQELQADGNITHIVARRLGPFEAEIIYRNQTFKVYRLP